MTYHFKDTVRDALSEVIERPVDDISENTFLDRDFDLDSVMFVHFLLSLEDRIPGLQFNPEDLAEASFNNVSLLLEFLEPFAKETEGQENAADTAAA
ncbi:MAG: acyl carrier protein [Sulfitobacter sp.]